MSTQIQFSETRTGDHVVWKDTTLGGSDWLSGVIAHCSPNVRFIEGTTPGIVLADLDLAAGIHRLDFKVGDEVLGRYGGWVKGIVREVVSPTEVKLDRLTVVSDPISVPDLDLIQPGVRVQMTRPRHEGHNGALGTVRRVNDGMAYIDFDSPDIANGSGHYWWRFDVITDSEAEPTSTDGQHPEFPLGTMIAFQLVSDGPWRGGRVTVSQPNSLEVGHGLAALNTALNLESVAIQKAPTLDDLERGDKVTLTRAAVTGANEVWTVEGKDSSDDTILVTTERFDLPNCWVSSWAVDKIEEYPGFPVGSAITYRPHGSSIWRRGTVAVSTPNTVETADHTIVRDGHSAVAEFTRAFTLDNLSEGDKVRIARRGPIAETVDGTWEVVRKDWGDNTVLLRSDGLDSRGSRWAEVWTLEKVDTDSTEATEALADLTELDRLREQVQQAESDLAEFRRKVRTMAFQMKREHDYCGELESFLTEVGLPDTVESTVKVTVTFDLDVEGSYIEEDTLSSVVAAEVSRAVRGVDWDSMPYSQKASMDGHPVIEAEVAREGA